MAYSGGEVKSFKELTTALGGVKSPVLLIEGIRALPDTDRAMVVAMGRMLAERMPGVTFRSGSADGTDTAFSEGVTAVAADRME